MTARPTTEELRRYETVYGVRDVESERDFRPVYYPVSDGMPMSDSQLGGAEMVRLTQTLQDWYADVPDVYVWMNLFVYYEPRNPRAVVSPDVFVAIGADKEPERLVYFIWREGVPPTVVFEVMSSSAHLDDQGPKRDTYARMGVKEYVLYDPHHEFMHPPLQFNRLEAGVYQRLEPDDSGGFESEALDLRLQLVDGRLRFFNRRTGAMLRSPAERTADAERAAIVAEEAAAEAMQRAEQEAEARRVAEQRAEREAEARRALEERIAALEARLRDQIQD
jgi:Uma2 family endonuclease